MRHKRIAADWWKVLQEDRNLTSGLPSADSLSPAPPGGTPEELGGRAEGAQGGRPLVRELWFIAVMAAAALLLLAAVLGAVLHKVLNKPPPYTRERPPLVGLPMQKRSPMAVYPASNPVLFDTLPDTAGLAGSVTLKGFSMRTEEALEGKSEPVAPQGELGVLSASALRRSVSQLMDAKPVGDEDAWEPNTSGHDSGMFMEDEEFVDAVKGFSTVRKEHTMFTDTNL